MIEEITSLKDSKIQLAKSLSSLKGRNENKKFLIEGLEAIKWALDSGVQIDFILLSNKIKDIDTIIMNQKLYSVSEGLLKKVTGTNYVISIVGIATQKEAKFDTDFCVVLDNLNDFGNIGTIVRTCNAFGVNNMLSTKEDLDLYQKKTVDASRGRVYNTNLKKFNSDKETICYLKKHNYQIVTTSPRGKSLQSMVELKNQPVALIVGNETHGASDEFMKNSDITVQIPMSSSVESLNVGVAAGISIYELKLKRLLGMIEKNIKSTLGREVNVLAKLMHQALDVELKKVSDLSSVQLIFMMVLKCDTQMTIKHIQEQFGIVNSDKDSFFNPLITKGYIVNNNNVFSITQIGIETMGKFWTVVENTEKSIKIDLTIEESEMFSKILNKLKKRCVELINQKVRKIK